jgi:hypothetical protein
VAQSRRSGDATHPDAARASRTAIIIGMMRDATAPNEAVLGEKRVGDRRFDAYLGREKGE